VSLPAALNIHMVQKDIAIDRYFTDFENGKIDQSLLEQRIEKLGRELRDLHRHRDYLRRCLDTEPPRLTNPDPATVSNHIGEIIACGTPAARRSMREATIRQLRLDLGSATATPSSAQTRPHPTLPNQRSRSPPC